MNIIKYIKAIVAVTILVIVAILCIDNYRLKESLYNYDNNFKALSVERDSLKETSIVYKFDLEQLEYINDSIINELNNTRKELKIKDKQIQQMQSIKTETTIKDSIFFKDTVFKSLNVKIDTLLSSEWYRIRLQLEYPNKLKITSQYKSDLSVFAYTNKEILGVPKKCFIGRLFQKKYNVIRVEVHDANPNSIIKESKFVIIE